MKDGVDMKTFLPEIARHVAKDKRKAGNGYHDPVCRGTDGSVDSVPVNVLPR